MSKVNLLEFTACFMKHCDCGCNFKLGMSHETAVRFFKVLKEAGFYLEPTANCVSKGWSLEDVEDYVEGRMVE